MISVCFLDFELLVLVNIDFYCCLYENFFLNLLKVMFDVFLLII